MPSAQGAAFPDIAGAVTVRAVMAGMGAGELAAGAVERVVAGRVMPGQSADHATDLVRWSTSCRPMSAV